MIMEVWCKNRKTGKELRIWWCKLIENKEMEKRK
jgi:hypothetical protein